MTALLGAGFSVFAFSPFWGKAGAAAGNHLWQSTLFAAAAGLLTLMLKNNRAQTRYALWLVASVKFLIPFSPLTELGKYLGGFRSLSHGQAFGVVMEVFDQPFGTAGAIHSSAVTPEVALQLAMRYLPAFLLAAWACGCVAVLFSWCARWRRLNAASRNGALLEAGREIEALRRLEKSMRTGKSMEVVISAHAIEPGVFGTFRPVLLLPRGITERLTETQMDAVIGHELCHVRRRDNLAATMHMLVEATFWFYPLVWWMGTQLNEERERACDEEVLQLGHEPQVYAESILKVCRF